MLYGLLVTLFVFVCILLILVILIQQGKGGLGLGYIGGGAQMLFGGSGGQDIFQKITWTLGAIFMAGSFILFVMGSKGTSYTRYIGKRAPLPQAQKAVPMPTKAEPLKESNAVIPVVEEKQGVVPAEKTTKAPEQEKKS